MYIALREFVPATLLRNYSTVYCPSVSKYIDFQTVQLPGISTCIFMESIFWTKDQRI
jgi:hypothetical protein